MITAMCIAVFALVPRALTTGRFITADETLWLDRTMRFSDAIFHGDLANASATTGQRVTMPGVTTMWIGTGARALRWIGGRLGLADASMPFPASPLGLHLAQLGVALTSSLLIGVIVLLAWYWAGPVSAVVGGALLASEPFLVAHGSLFHTDSLTALFGTAGVLALLIALDIPSGAVARPRAMAALSGVLLAGALLTKLSALPLLLGAALVVVGALLTDAVRIRRSGQSLGASVWRWASLLLLAGSVALATIILAWPAIWADPTFQLAMLQQSAGLADIPHVSFFLGQITGTPGWLFYAVATPLRMTPWFLIGLVVLLPLALADGRRWHVVIVLATAATILTVLSTAAKQMDRYLVTALPFLALAAGLGVDALVHALRPRAAQRRRLGLLAGLAAVALMTVHAVSIAPWGLAYFNPLLGGPVTAERAVMVGWGEGLELAGEMIRRREAPGCNVTIGLKYWILQAAFPCGRTTNDLEHSDYVVLYVNQRQRLTAEELASLRQRGQLVGTVIVRGIDYVEVYDTRAKGEAHAAASGAIMRAEVD